MKTTANELIKALQEQVKRHGDLPVRLCIELESGQTEDDCGGTAVVPDKYIVIINRGFK